MAQKACTRMVLTALFILAQMGNNPNIARVEWISILMVFNDTLCGIKG